MACTIGLVAHLLGKKGQNTRGPREIVAQDDIVSIATVDGVVIDPADQQIVSSPAIDEVLALPTIGNVMPITGIHFIVAIGT